jgi:cytochrome oxidase Cu insertion factor (SCO1/SenC/PrrC family)
MRYWLTSLCLALLLNSIANSSHSQLGSHLGSQLGHRYGGDFTLTDHHGRPFSLQDARGKVVLINFGFTSCADTCPTTLAKLGRALHELGGRSEWVQVLFVTVDSKRDTSEVLRPYTTYFHPNILGLTGTQQQVETVAKLYRTPVQVRRPDKQGYYVVDHGSRVFLIDRHGSLASVMFYETSAQDIAEKIEALLNRP